MTTTGDNAPTGALDLNKAFRGGAHSVEFLGRINRASLVMLAEATILPPATARRIAAGMQQVFEAGGATPPWSADYLDYEPHLLAVAGQEGSLLHSGRSRQDMSATITRMNVRQGLLEQLQALLGARERLLAQAERYKAAIVPAYTHGVQAQPTTFGHYLLAFGGTLGRSTGRLRAAYRGINLCPLGSAALATSSFPVNRQRLAALLGFEGLIENSYDANHFAPVDGSLEAAAALAIAAVQIGQFAQDLHAQYADPTPWITLQQGALMGVSSIMPQKRNPAALEQLRVQSSMLLGEMQAVPLTAHNIGSGMFDYRTYDPVPAGRALTVFGLLDKVLGGLVLDEARALDEVRNEYSTTTEIADALLQRCGVPFRTGHHFASVLTDYGRARRLRLGDISYAEVAQLYQSTNGEPLPLDEAAFAEAVSPEYMVSGRRGTGGPQPAEMDRMLARGRDELAADRTWLDAETARLADAGRQLDTAFAPLARAA
jgi:argininosuccinate lyase